MAPIERDRAVLDVGQERVLLGLVEAVDLVDEQDRLLAVEGEPLASLGDQGAHLGHAAHDRGDGHQPAPDGVGEHAGEARLAAAGRAPEEERAEVAALQGPAQRAALADQVLVADDLVERPRAHSGRQRLASGRRHERGLLFAGFAGRLGVGAARCHESMLQAGLVRVRTNLGVRLPEPAKIARLREVDGACRTTRLRRRPDSVPPSTYW